MRRSENSRFSLLKRSMHAQYDCGTFYAFREALLRSAVQVYATLAAALVVSAGGVYFNLVTGLGGWLSMIAFVVCSVWLAVTPNEPKNLNKRCVHPRNTGLCSKSSS